MNITKKPILNNVKNRFLPIPESVKQCLEPEPKIQDFEIVKELGAGSFGHVFLVVHKLTRVQYAIKAINKKNKTNIEEKPYFRREIEIMYKVHHPNVVRLFSHFEDDKYCYFIMEYISKGNIFNLIPKDKTKKLSGQIIASILRDVISAVYFLHHMDPPIIHRDIKPENVLLAEGKIAKLTDFGWSNYMQGTEKRTTVCGTPIYLAPEIVNEAGHDERVDNWCIGVLLFELSTGTMPFLGNDMETLKSNIRDMRIVWPRDINLKAKNLIMKILKYDPKARLSLEEMMNHPFFTTYFPEGDKCLIKPNKNVQLPPFVVSKDNPNDPKWTNLMKVNGDNKNNVNEDNKSNEIKQHSTPNKEANVIKVSEEEVKTRGRGITEKRRDFSPLPPSLLHLEKLNLGKIGNLIEVHNPKKKMEIVNLKEGYERLVKENQNLKDKIQKDEEMLKSYENEIIKLKKENRELKQKLNIEDLG